MNDYKPMTQFPPKVEGENFSDTVLIFDEDLEDFDLGYYDYDNEKWIPMGDFQMDLICWIEISKPVKESVEGYKSVLTE